MKTRDDAHVFTVAATKFIDDSRTAHRLLIADVTAQLAAEHRAMVRRSRQRTRRYEATAALCRAGHATHKQEMGISKCKTYQGR
jgi:hypothetical protein